MKNKLYSIAILLAICGGRAFAQTDERDRHVATATEIAAQTFTYIHGERTGFISASHSFEFVFGVAPATAAISITPCMQGGSCGTAVTSTSTANQVITTSGIWDQYNIVVTTTGTPLSIVVNITGTHSSFLKLTTLGSGAATLVNNVLNIPVGGAPGSGCTPGSTSAVLKGDGAGGCGPATAGTDYVVPAGNVATATLLQNARQINGVSFNGGADITVTVPVATGITGLGTNMAAFLATPSSANFAAAITNETGSGFVVLNTSPTFVTPILGTPTSGDATNLVNLNASQLTLGTIPTAATAALTGDATKSAGLSAVTVVALNGVNLAGLATGLMKNTTGTGAPGIAAVADVSALIKTLTGCSTTAFVYTPQDNDCVAAGGGTNPMTTLGDETYGGASGALTRLAGPTTTAHVFTLADIPVASAAVAETWYDLTANVPLLASANTFTATQTVNGQITENQQDTTNTHGFTLNNSSLNRVLTMAYDAVPTLQINWGSTRAAVFTGLATAANAWTFSTSISSALYNTATNCASAAAPAVCGSAAAGAFTIAAGGTTVTVNTTAVTANSDIELQPDESLGTRLSVTCNTTIANIVSPVVTARTAGTSFSIAIPGTGPITNPACYSYTITN